MHQVAAHVRGVAARRWIGDVLRLDARVGKRNRLRARVIGQQRKGEGQCAHRARALEELAPVDAAVAVLVVELENLLVDLRLGDGSHAFSVFGSLSRKSLAKWPRPSRSPCSKIQV